jgi:CysZ protein
MIIEAARRAFATLFQAETRSVFFKVLALSIITLTALWIGVRQVFIWLAMPWLSSLVPGVPDWAGWLALIFGILASIGLALALALLIAPVTALIASIFLDGIAEIIEQRDYASDPPGRAMPLSDAMITTLRFFGIVLLGNLVALFLLLVPGINLIAFFLVNGYLLGREFFEFAAMRYHAPDAARAFRADHAGQVFLAGLLIALFLAIPIVNLVTPLFAASLMVHLHKLLQEKATQQKAAGMSGG